MRSKLFFLVGLNFLFSNSQIISDATLNESSKKDNGYNICERCDDSDVQKVRKVDLNSRTTSIKTTNEYDIRYNQIGYFPNQSKYIYLVSTNSFSPLSYQVFDENNNIILEGTSESVHFWNDGEEFVSRADVSSIVNPGLYEFRTDALEINFIIGTNIYEELSKASLKYYYFHRASTAISSEYGGVYSRNMGHPDEQVIVHSSAASDDRPAGTIISSPKGWYDAGDYNKYIVSSGISTYTLLAAFEHYKDYFRNKSLEISLSASDIPDLLEEIKWNLDWMLTMQDPSDGGVYHKLTGLNFSGIIMPEDDNQDRYVVQKSTAAALNFAAVMAVASRVFSEYDEALPGYSTVLLNASENAYSWAQQNPSIYFTNPHDVFTGEYGDTNLNDEFQWAAVELFITTKFSTYWYDINISSIGGGTPSWPYTDPLALISILHHHSIFPSYTVTMASNSFLSTANSIKNQVQNSIMNTVMGETNWDYIWGSNGNAANKVLILIRAYEYTNNASYLDAAYTAMDYLFGRNGIGYCYITGFGHKSPLNPHHRISEADEVIHPIPGMLVGGPNPNQEDGCTNYISNSNAGSYSDDWCSYASNEVTINWNAPLAYIVNALHFYKNQWLLSTIKIEDVKDQILIHPNPANRKLTIKSALNIQSIHIIDSLGKVILSEKSNIIDVSTLKRGVYYLRIETFDNKFYIRKFVSK